jgi:hypothetical protein
MVTGTQGVAPIQKILLKSAFKTDIGIALPFAISLPLFLF